MEMQESASHCFDCELRKTLSLLCFGQDACHVGVQLNQ